MEVTSNEARDAAAPKDTTPERAAQGVPSPLANPSTMHDAEACDESLLADPKFAACLERLEGHWPKPKLKTPPLTFQRLGRFEIRRELGRGRFGVVFLAWDPQLQRQVALKVPQFDAAMDPELRERFRGEALSAGQLQHPGIVSIYDVGQHAGVDYLAMAYVDGMTLAERLQAGPLPPAEAARLIAQLANAVHHAHQQGVIHRDLKPSNVLLDQAGAPHVTDFGLARRLSDSAMRATQTGQVLGTPTYMSPEQAVGQSDIGPASDVYALGVILYETITGRPPFQAATFVEAVEFILKRDPLLPSKLNPKLPRELDAITFKCLEKRASARYASAAELANDLQCYLEGKPIRARTLGAAQRTFRWARKNPSQALLVVATLVLIGLLLSISVVYDRWQHADALAAEQRTSAETQRTIAETQRYFATVSQARNMISRRQPGWSWLAQQELEKAAALNLPVVDRSELRQLATECLTGFDTQKAVTIDAGLLIGRLAVSPDGSRLALGELKGNTNCRVVVYDTQTRKPLHTFSILNAGWKRALLGEAKWQDGVREFAFSSDSRYLAVGMRFGDVHVYDLQQPEKPPRDLLVSKERELEKIAFSADGDTLFAQTKADSEFIRWQDWKRDTNYDSPWSVKPNSFAVAPVGNGLFVGHAGRAPFQVFNQQLEARTYFSPIAKLPHATDSRITTDGTGSLLAGFTDYGLSVYEAHGGVFVRRLQDDTVGDQAIAHQLTFSHDGHWLMGFNEYAGIIRFFDVAGGQQAMRLDLPRHDFQDAALDPQFRWLAIANDKQLEFWALKQNSIRTAINNPSETIEDMEFAPNSKWLACVSTAGPRFSPARTTLATIACETGEVASRRSGGIEHLGWGTEEAQVIWSANSCELLAATTFGTMAWRTDGEGQLSSEGFTPLNGRTAPVTFELDEKTARGESAPVVERIPHPRDPSQTCLQIEPRNQLVVLKCWLASPLKIQNRLPTLAISLKIDADPTLNAPLTFQLSLPNSPPNRAPPWTWLNTNGNFHWWTMGLPPQAKELSEFELHIDVLPHAHVRSLTIERLEFVELELPPKHRLAKFSTVQHIKHLVAAPSGTQVWGSVAEEIRCWNWPDAMESTDKVQATWKNPNHQVTGAGNIRALQVGREGIVVGTRDGRVHWLDPATGKSRDSWPGAGQEVVSLALCDDAQLVLAAGENGVVRGLSLPRGEVAFDFAADDLAIVALAATPDGQSLVTASSTRALKVWRRTTNPVQPYQLFCELPPTVSVTKSLCLSADGKYLAVLGNATGCVELWNLPALETELRRLGIE